MFLKSFPHTLLAYCDDFILNAQKVFFGLIHMICCSSGVGSVMEPIAAIPLNDELQRARALVATAEEEVLSKLSDKVEGFEEINY